MTAAMLVMRLLLLVQKRSSAWSRPWWAVAAAGRLLVQRVGDCCLEMLPGTTCVGPWCCLGVAWVLPGCCLGCCLGAWCYLGVAWRYLFFLFFFVVPKYPRFSNSNFWKKINFRLEMLPGPMHEVAAWAPGLPSVLWSYYEAGPLARKLMNWRRHTGAGTHVDKGSARGGYGVIEAWVPTTYAASHPRSTRLLGGH